MSGARLPTVRLPAIVAGRPGDEEHPDAVVVELPVSGRFELAWPPEPPPPIPTPAELSATVTLSSSEGETDVSEEEPTSRERRPPRTDESDDFEFVTPTNHLLSDRDPMDQVGHPTVIPRISRAFSMPLPSQLGPFQNPRRVAPDAPPAAGPSEEPVHLQELSLELADSVQMVIQTLLQLSPPQVLDPAKEQFSACSLAIPTPSVSAMFTSMKNLNYMSANMSTLGTEAQSAQRARARSEAGSSTYVDFDIGEMLQSVGDALSGVAAQAGVDLVLFHDELDMRHVAVKGDESGLSYTLSHVSARFITAAGALRPQCAPQILRQVISVAKRGDSIEIGLFIESAKNPQRSLSPGAPSRSGSPELENEGPLRCSFHIAHRFGMLEAPSPKLEGEEASGEASEEPAPTLMPSRNQPSFKTLILRRLLQHINARLESDVAPRAMFVGRCCVLSTTLDRGAPSVVDPAFDLSPEEAVSLGYPAEMRISHEPTLEQLTQFAESLRGRKVTLFAHSKGSFARHLTSYLTSWGLDVSHVSTEPDAESPAESGEKRLEGDPAAARESAAAPASAEHSPSNPSPPSLPQQAPEPFFLIDDDVSALRAKLQKIRADQAYPLTLHGRKRPSLAQHHRPRSSPQVARVMGMTPMPAQVAPQVVIVHFTSLANFKLVKDAIQSILAAGNSWSRLPEVIVVPKPAGPRRILTALHTAVTKPIVDPFFVPIATSPVSPSFHPMSPLLNPTPAQRSPGGRSTGSFRTSSDRSAKSPKETDTVSLAPSSPLGVPDNMEYFSDAATKLGSSPSSGMVIQSPDGQPAGIFFHPKVKGKAAAPTARARAHSVEEHPAGRARGSSSRRISDGDDARRSLAFAPVADAPRRSPQQESAPPESVYEPVPPPTAAKAKGRAPPAAAEGSVESPEVSTMPVSEQVGASQASPKLTREPSQDPRTSPPLSPQARAGAAPAPRRQTSKRPTAEGAGAAAGAGGKKGVRAAEGNIIPPISVLIVDGMASAGALCGWLLADVRLGCVGQTTRSTRRFFPRS